MTVGSRLAWLILAVAASSLVVGSGVRSLFGVLLPLMESDLHYDRATLSAVASVAFLLYALAQPVAGWVVIRVGPKRALLVGAAMLVLSGAGMIWASSLPALYLFIGALPSLGLAAGGLIPGTVLAMRWFSRQRGLAAGIIAGSLPAGQAIFAALVAMILLVASWREAYVILTLGCSIALLSLIIFVVRDTPEATADSPTSSSTVPIRRLAQTRNFWILAAGFVACGVTDQIMLIHLVPFLSDEGYSTASGGGIFALLSLAGLAGSILVGPMVDAFGARYILASVYFLRALSYPFLFAFSTTDSATFVIVFAIVFGLTYMANMPPTGVLVHSAYGSEAVGPAIGWLTLIHHLGGAGGVLLTGIIYERTGEYTVPFVASTVFLLLAGGATLMISKRRQTQKDTDR